jgi:hypothetical protein
MKSFQSLALTNLWPVAHNEPWDISHSVLTTQI